MCIRDRGQAAAAYFGSYLFARSGSYALLFALGGTVLAAALVMDLRGAAIRGDVGRSRQWRSRDRAESNRDG